MADVDELVFRGGPLDGTRMEMVLHTSTLHVPSLATYLGYECWSQLRYVDIGEVAEGAKVMHYRGYRLFPYSYEQAADAILRDGGNDDGSTVWRVAASRYQVATAFRDLVEVHDVPSDKAAALVQSVFRAAMAEAKATSTTGA